MCLKCGKALELSRDALPTYAWHCPDRCLPAVDTGVPVSENIEDFQKALTVYAAHNLVISAPLTQSHITGARVYAPEILMHFIECTWGSCYNSIYLNFLVPYFSSVAVLDYVLRSPVLVGAEVMQEGVPAPKIFGDLLFRLQGVKSPEIQRYLKATFEAPASPPIQ